MSETPATKVTGTESGTAGTSEGDTDDTKKPVKEIPVIHDQGFFRHDTGDMYDGFFEAKKKDRTAKMHGQGVYTTVEGDSYMGQWESDKFGGGEEVVISYIDGSKYEGPFKDWCYYNRGKYTYPDGSMLQGEFSENCPTGSLVLTDPNGHTWLGKADQGFGWFEPVNHFFEFLEAGRDQAKTKRRKHGKASSPTKTKTSPTKSN